MTDDTDKGQYSPELDEPHETKERADSTAQDGEPEALKPCPFCGGEASERIYEDESLWSHNVVDWFEASCGNDCDILMVECEYRDRLVERWNRRPKTAERTIQHFEALLRDLKADRNKWRIEAMAARDFLAMKHIEEDPGGYSESDIAECAAVRFRWEQARDRNQAEPPEIKTAANHGLYTEPLKKGGQPAPEIPPTEEVLGNAVQMPDMTAIERIEGALEFGGDDETPLAPSLRREGYVPAPHAARACSKDVNAKGGGK